MAATIRYYTINDFLRLDEHGKMDWEKARNVIALLTTALTLDPDQHVLFDLRKTLPTVDYRQQRHKIPDLIAAHMGWYEGKIAALVTDEPEHLSADQKVKEGMIAKGFQFNFFHEFEAAIDWLAEITPGSTS